MKLVRILPVGWSRTPDNAPDLVALATGRRSGLAIGHHRRRWPVTPSTRLRLQEILERIGQNRPVALAERIKLQKYADRDRRVADWLRQARRRQLQQRPAEGLDQLLEGLNLGCVEPDETFRPDDDELEGWFGGAPDWLRRS